MTEKYIPYSVDGRSYKIPVSKSAEFETEYPNATIRMSVEDRTYNIPISKKSEFMNTYSNATYSFDKPKKEEDKVIEEAAVIQPQEEPMEQKKSFWQKFSEAATEANMAQRGGYIDSTAYSKPTIEEIKADANIADSVIESHNETKSNVENTIARIDEEYNANPQQDKSFWEKFSEAVRNTNSRVPAAAYYRADKQREDAEKGQDYVDAKIAQHIINKTEDKIDQYSDPASNFFEGAAEGFVDTALSAETWDSTIGLERAARVHTITNKLDRGETLTDGEQMIVDALVDDLASDMYLASGFGRGYKAGKVTGESIPFMVETMLNPASKMGEAITKKFGSAILKKVSNKLLGKAAVAAARVGGDIAGAALMSATTSQANIAADALNRLNGQVDFTIDEDGKFNFNGFVGGEDNGLKAYAKAYGANTIEHFSEMVGEYFAPIGKAVGGWSKKGAIAAADAIGAKKISALLSEMTPNGFGSALNDFIETTQWHGPIGEFAEEMVSGAMNALVVGDQSLKKYDKDGNLNPNYLFEKENMIDTFLGVAILGGVMSTAKTVGYTTPETKFNRKISRAKKNLSGHVSESELAQLEAFAQNPFGVDYANLEPFFGENRDAEYKLAVAEYLDAIMQKQGYLISQEAKLSGTQQGMEEMKNAFKFGQNMTEADLYDVDEAEAKAMQALADTGYSNDIEGVSSYDLYRWSTDASLAPEQQIALHDLAVIRNAKEGLNNSLNSVAQAAIAANDNVANSSANNGILTVGLYNGRKVYVKGGVNVVDGSIVRPSGVSGYPVEVVDSMTGEVSTIDSKEISSAANVDVNAYNTSMAGIINNYYQQRWDSWRQKKSAKSKLSEIEQFVGKKVFIDTENGMSEVEVQQILPNGEVLIKGKKGDLGGQSTMRVDVDSFYDSMSRDNNGNPIFNQSEFRSQTENIKAAQNRLYGNEQQTNATPTATTAATEQTAPQAEEVAEPQTPQTEESIAQPQEAAEPLTSAENIDYRGEEVTILINGQPISVEVTSQDSASNTITYEYTDENGNTKIGSSSINAFIDALNQAKAITQQETETTAPQPTNETPSVEVEEPIADSQPTPESAPMKPEDIDWEALFESNPEDYFSELQNQFGDKATDILDMEINAAREDLEALEKKKGKNMNERVKNLDEIARLRLKLGILEDFRNRLTATQEITPEVTPEVPTTPADTATPKGEETTPKAPVQVANPIEEAKKKDRELYDKLQRTDLDDATKRDLAFSAGKAVGNLFATREEYDAYIESLDSLSFGKYGNDYDRGVDESFAKRTQQETGNPEGNSVPLAEPKAEENGEQGLPESDTDGQGDGGNSGRTTNEGETQGNQGNPQEESERGGQGDSGKQELENRYPARKGNATKQLLIDTFGFSNVTIPNTQKQVLNTIYDFMMAMSKMLGISPKSIGNGGWLEVGNLPKNARPLAKYSYRYRNITEEMVQSVLKFKYEKLNSIAHEWWHSLDHVLAFFNTGYGATTASEVKRIKFNGRQEVYEAIQNILNAIYDSGHTKRISSLNYPLSHTKYLLEPSEQLARAFEEYIAAKFAEAGIVIEGLDHSYDNNPQQPTIEEMAVIAPLFDKLFSVLQEKEGKTAGTSVLFQIGQEMDVISDTKTELGNMAVGWVRQGGNVVVTDAAEMQTALAGGANPLSTPNGIVYGFVKDGVAYYNPSVINPNTAIHEYTHLWDNALMQLNPALWKRGKELMKQTPIWNEVINDPNYADIKDNEDLVASEVHSRLVGAKGAERLNQLEQQARAEGLTKSAKKLSILGRLREWLNEATAWLKDAFSSWTQSEIDNVTLTDFLNMPLRDLAEFKKVPQVGTITNANGDFVAEANGKGTIQFNIKTWREGGREYLENWLNKDKTLTKEEKADILARMDEFYENAQKYTDIYVPFGAWSDAAVKYDKDGNPLMSVIKKNGDYSMNLDFSLVCKKRRPLNMLLRTLINRNAFGTYSLRERELAEINWILQEHGFEVACALCFVDSKRYRVTGVADVFASLYNQFVKALAPDGAQISHFNYSNNPNVEVVENGVDTLPDEQLNWKRFDELASKFEPTSVEGKVAEFLRKNPSQRRLVDSTDFIDATGFEAVKESNPALLSLYNSKKGTGGPKASFGDVQYLNDILKKSRSFSAKKAYEVGGVRIQSFSDFVPHMYFDYMQLFAELSAKKLPAHAYTKEVLFAKIFGLTGLKINMSLVPAVVEGGIAPGLDANGNYAWADAVKDKDGNIITQAQSFPYDEAMAIQNAEGYSKNCGVIAVGISDEHIEKMLDDANIPFIIPYHKSSLNAIVARMTNIDQYKDYTNVQNTRKADGTKLEKGEKDFNFNAYLQEHKGSTPQEAAQAYLDWCRKNNYKPKFSQFAYHPNYFKLLVDFNTIDSLTGEYTPQGPVSMTFPTKDNSFGDVETLIQQGLAEDAALEEKMTNEIEEVADEVEKRLKEIKEEPELSEKQYAEHMAKLADERMAKIQDLASGSEDIVEVDRDSMTFSEEKNAIRERAKAEGTFMKAPNGQPTKLTEDQWLTVRTEAFKKWFGDWELSYQKDFLLNGTPVSQLSGKEFEKEEGKTLTDLVEKFFNEIGGKATSPIFGDVILDRKGADDSLSHGVGRTKAVAYASVKDVIEKGILIDYESDHKGRGYDSALIAAPITIGSENYICSVVITRKADNRFYLHEVIEQKWLSDEGSNTAQRQPQHPKAFANILQKIKDAKDSSKVVDENGEPLVVYHGSPYGSIEEFNRKGHVTSGLREYGSYFSTNYRLAQLYAYARQQAKGDIEKYEEEKARLNAIIFNEYTDPRTALDAFDELDRLEESQKPKVYEVFLNIRNPKVFDAERLDGYRGWHKLKQDVGYDIKSGHEAMEALAGHNSAAKMDQKYDGIIAKNMADVHSEEGLDELMGDVFLVFDETPANIKSATSNVGTFDAADARIRYRRADEQNAAVDYLAGDERNFAIENAVNEEAAKLGVTVTYKTRSEMPKGHQNDKGYFNTTTGEIVICTENAASIADAIKTILHEAVAHKGLRQLMGDRFNEFINRVYNHLDAKTKAKVDALARDHYDGNTAVAMEEYMATLAESENFAETSVWEKIKSFFEQLINDILGRDDIRIGDNELRYILRASYNNMVNPRGMETVRGWAQEQMMREEYGINKAETPEILSRAGVDADEVARIGAAQVYDKVVNQTWQEFQRQFQDAYQPVRIAIEAIQKETGNIPIEDYENYLLMQNQSSSRSRVETDNFARRYYSPIIEQVNAVIDAVMASRGFNRKERKNPEKRAEVYKEILQYLIAKHGLERNEYYQARNTRKLTPYEQKKEINAAYEELGIIVDQLNADTTLSDVERELEIRKAADECKAKIEEIKTREVPDIRDYSGLTALFGMDKKKFREAEAEARKYVDEFEKNLGRIDDDTTGEMLSQSEIIERLWDKINAATNKTLSHSYESGLLSRQQYNDIKSMFNFYIPLRGFDETTAEDVYAYARFEGNRFNPAVQTAKGRTSLADDPIAIIMNMAESEIAQGNKNRAKQALYNFLLNRASGRENQNSLMRIEDVWYVETVDATGNTVYQIAAPDYEKGETYEDFEQRMNDLAEQDKAYKSKKGMKLGLRFQKQMNKGAHYVYLKVNGVEKAIYVAGNPKAADAINGTYAPKMGKGMEYVKTVQRILSSTFTNYSLEFTARNFFRDMIYSHLNIGVRESDPAYRKKFRQNWRHNNMRSMLKMLSAYKSGELLNRPLNEDEAAFVEFMENGGQTGYTLINSVEAHKKDLERAIARMQKGIEKGGVKDSAIFKYTLGGIELLNEASELVTRFAAYKTSRDMGRGVVKSISDAKEVTVNFNTKGAQDGNGVFGVIARYMGAVKYFFNASVQGVQNISEMAKANKGKFGAVVAGTIGLGILMPIIQGALWDLLGDDDDEYWNIPEYERQNNLCFVVGKGKYVKIPLPIGFREMYGIGDMIIGGIQNKKFTRDLFTVGIDVANKIATIVLPINPLEGSANGLSLIESAQDMIFPDATQGIIQNRTNKDWKGAPIQKEYTYNEHEPQWTKAFSNNPAWLTGLSKWCYEHIIVDGRSLDFSPEKLDNTLSNTFGGIYSLAKKAGKTVSTIWNEDNRTLSNVPLVGVIVGSGTDKDERFVNSAYWEMDEYYNSRIALIKSTADKFGLSLDDVFKRVPEGEAKAGEHHPAMNKIYNRDNFDFMQEWYLGHKGEGLTDENGNKILGLSQIKNKIKSLETKIKKNENHEPTLEQAEGLANYNNQYESLRRDFVNEMLELD